MVKSCGVDLSESDVFDFMDATVSVTGLTVRTLWPYSKGLPSDWKRPPVWCEIRKNSFALSYLFDKTHGLQANHNSMIKHVHAWLLKNQIEWTSPDVNLVVYRLRAQMAQMRDWARDKKTAPRGYEHLGSVLSKIATHAAEPLKPLQQSEVPKQPLKRSLQIESSDESAVIVSHVRRTSSSSSLMTIDDVEQLLWGPTPKRRKVGKQPDETPNTAVEKQPVVETPKKNATSAYTHLLSDMPSPPLPGDVQKKFRDMKRRPAAAMKKPSAKVPGHQ